jgi:hypothetical protein
MNSDTEKRMTFLLLLSRLVLLDAPGPKDVSPEYCFENEIRLTHAEDHTSKGFMDLYRGGGFVLKAKKGGRSGSANARGTRSYDRYLEHAFGQVVRLDTADGPTWNRPTAAAG